jgi:NADPH-dependent glutamate synthase beta subunit-like oxidoreductase
MKQAQLTTKREGEFSYTPPTRARRNDVMTDPVLIVGAGPTGLTAALELSRMGVAVRLIDNSDRGHRDQFLLRHDST